MQQCLHTNNMFPEQQISILEWYLKDYVVVMLKIQLCITRINYVLKYIQMKTVILKLLYILIE